MKNIFFIFACLVSFSAAGQVKFKLRLLADQKTYQVSLLPEATWVSPFNITSTAQITFVVPTESFEPKNVQNLQPGVEWHFNSRTNAPSENPAFDYVSVGLKSLGTSNLFYQNGLEIALFTFENAQPCTGSIRLLDHVSDPFFKNLNKKANIGNYLSVYGAGGDAYVGNFGAGEAVCSGVSAGSDVSDMADFSLSPNPFYDELNFSTEWKNAPSAAQISITDALGKVVFNQNFEPNSGKNTLRFDLRDLVPGVYSVTLKTGERVVFSRKVVKTDM
jgi:hypothetical protein